MDHLEGSSNKLFLRDHRQLEGDAFLQQQQQQHQQLSNSTALLHKIGGLQSVMQMIVECGNEEQVTGMAKLVDDLLESARSMLNPQAVDDDEQHQQRLLHLQQLKQQQQHQQELQELHKQQQQQLQEGDLGHVLNGLLQLPKAEDVPWLEDHLYQAMAMVKQENPHSGATTVVLDGDHSSDDGSYELVQMDAMEILAEHTHFCEICGKGFKRDANLRMHMRGHGDEYKSPAALARPEASFTAPPAKKKRYSCPYVGCKRNREHKKFVPLKTILCVKNHYRRSHCPKKLTCTRCGVKKFAVLADLKTHEKHCGREKWQCSCGTTFSRKDKLLGHVALFVGHSPLSLHAPSLSTPILIPSSSLYDRKSSSSSSGSSSGSTHNKSSFQEHLLLGEQGQQLSRHAEQHQQQQHQLEELHQQHPDQNQQNYTELRQLQREQAFAMPSFATADVLVVSEDENWSLFAPIIEEGQQQQQQQMESDTAAAAAAAAQSFGFLGLDFLDCKN